MAYIYPVIKKNTTQYTTYYWYNKKKIYIGIYPSEMDAQEAYNYVEALFKNSTSIEDYNHAPISFQKFISLVNFRDHGVLIHQPIYLYEKYFKYFLSQNLFLMFDLKDLFYFSSSKIYKRGNYLYTNNSHSQQSILSRFGILPKSICGIDYIFRNGNRYDFRRENIYVCNHYYGVSCKSKQDSLCYTTHIFHNKKILVGHYDSEIKAAIAYNKAIDLLKAQGISREYISNTIPYLTKSEYETIYNAVEVSSRLYPSLSHKKIASSSGYRGTYKDKTGFKAAIGYNKKQIHLGNYPTQDRAAQAYNFASLYLYGQDGYLNHTTPLICDSDEEKIYQKLAKAGVLKK